MVDSAAEVTGSAVPSFEGPVPRRRSPISAAFRGSARSGKTLMTGTAKRGDRGGGSDEYVPNFR